jgi:hypothetical protein
MAMRNCAVCGENRDVSGGVVCEKGHFICAKDAGKASSFSHTITRCPVCKSKVT